MFGHVLVSLRECAFLIAAVENPSSCDATFVVHGGWNMPFDETIARGSRNRANISLWLISIPRTTHASTWCLSRLRRAARRCASPTRKTVARAAGAWYERTPATAHRPSMPEAIPKLTQKQDVFCQRYIELRNASDGQTAWIGGCPSRRLRR